MGVTDGLRGLPWQIFDNGRIVADKRPPGRPRTNPPYVRKTDAPTVGCVALHATAGLSPQRGPA